MVAGEISRRKALATIQAQIGIATKQRLIIERWQIIVPQIARVPALAHRSDDGIDLEDGPSPRQRVGPAEETEDGGTAGVGHLLLMVQASGFSVIDPLKWHASHVRAQHGLSQRHPLGGARVDAEIIEVDACHRRHAKA